MKLKGRPVTWWRRDEVNFLNNVAPPIGTKNRGRTHRGNKISAECRAFFFQLSNRQSPGKSKMHFAENVFRRKFVLSQFYFRTSSTKIQTKNTKKTRHAEAENNEVHV